jgi:hypothetical protein
MKNEDGSFTFVMDLSDPRNTLVVSDERMLPTRDWKMKLEWVNPCSISVGRFPATRRVKYPSFPHALSGGSTGLTTGGFGTGPPIKTFWGDAFKTNLVAEF